MDFQENTKLGRYEIHSLIGAGGMGVVSRDDQPKNNLRSNFFRFVFFFRFCDIDLLSAFVCDINLAWIVDCNGRIM
jgi:hypothetical protein